MTTRFPLLSTLAWLMQILGLFLGSAGAFVLWDPKDRMEDDPLRFVVGLGLLAIALIMAAAGEVVGVLFAIEKNTHATTEAIQSLKVKRKD